MHSKVMNVARWEFMEKVKTKAFFISLIMMPIIIGIFGVLPGILASKEDEKTKSIGVIDQSGILVPMISEKVTGQYKLKNGDPNYSIIRIQDSDTTLSHLRTIAKMKLLDGTIDGFFILPSSVMENGNTEYYSKNVGNIRDQERFSKTLENVIVERRLLSKGYDPKEIKELTTRIDVKTVKINDKGEEKESGFLETFFTGYLFIMMLMFLVLTSGQMLIRSVVEEKSNRIVEVLLSSCSPKELMTGKVLGLSLLGITTVAFWVILMVTVNLFTQNASLSVENLGLMLIYFILGYLLYAAIFVAVGAPLSTEQEAQQATTFVSLSLVFPIALAIPVMQNPDSLMVKIVTLIPIFTPSFMALRLSIQTPEWWEIAASILILIGSIIGMMWVASKIFRIGILVTGKRPNLKEMYKWLTTDV